MKITEQNYNDFFFDLSAGLLRELGAGYEARPITNTKNNGILRNGILIRREDESTAPAIYLDEYYTDFCTGRCLSDIIRQVLYTYHGSAQESRHQLFQEIDFTPEAMRDKVVFRIVNYERNLALLQTMPHIRIFDLAIIFHFVVYQDEDGIGTVKFTKEHFKAFCDSPDGNAPILTTLGELYQLALENTKKLFPVKLSALDDVLEALLAQKGAPPIPFFAGHPGKEIADGTLFVLSNMCGINGSACILYPGILAQLTTYFQSDFYVLPSSIHELLLLPAPGTFRQEELNDMIREINLTQVPEEEILSDRAYFSGDLLRMLRAQKMI